MDDELVLVCGNSHRFAGMRVIQPQELEKESFIIREKGSGTRKLFEDMMTTRGLAWKASWTCNNSDTIKAAVAAGLGVTVISKRTVAREAKAGELCMKRLDGISLARKFILAHHKNKYLTDHMKAFIGCALKQDY